MNLLVKEGTVHALVGLNGAGKTTTFKILLGLMHPDKGKIKLLDKAPGNPTLKDRIGYLPENFNPPRNLTGRELLHYINIIHGKRRNTDEILKMVGLEKEGKKLIKAFSRGMIQRSGIAQAMIHDPDLLILDEPFSGLDPAGRIELKEIMLKLKKRGKTILFSTHILQDVIDIGDSASIIHKGKIILTASVSELREVLSEKDFLKMVISHEGNDNANVNNG
ncbi:MAG: ABC transporter ATP-binding protein [Synergistetes bacterium]|nr:ABC transporter ATP-binding protein [Synergistota bacterium]